MDNIFKSCFNLSFCNEYYEIEYQKNKDIKIKNSIKTFILFILIFAIIVNLTNSLNHECEKISYLRMLYYVFLCIFVYIFDTLWFITPQEIS